MEMAPWISWRTPSQNTLRLSVAKEFTFIFFVKLFLMAPQNSHLLLKIDFSVYFYNFAILNVPVAVYVLRGILHRLRYVS